jgi:hypothetical protein
VIGRFFDRYRDLHNIVDQFIQCIDSRPARSAAAIGQFDRTNRLMAQDIARFHIHLHLSTIHVQVRATDATVRHTDNGVFRGDDGELGNIADLDRLGTHPLGRPHHLCRTGLLVRSVDWTVPWSALRRHDRILETMLGLLTIWAL